MLHLYIKYNRMIHMELFYQPRKIHKDYINSCISILYDAYGYKVIATSYIPKNTIIVQEEPIYNIFGEHNNNRTIQILYEMCKQKDNRIDMLYPREYIEISRTNPYNFHTINIMKDIKKYNDKNISSYLLSIDSKQLEIYYYKYLFNAFDMYNSPTILFIGAKFNHSCTPNITFHEKDNVMIFQTNQCIEKGTELMISYLRNTTNIYTQTYLSNHYNFRCRCKKCQYEILKVSL